MEEIKLLLVEDNHNFRKVTKDNLEMMGKYEVFEAANGLEGYNAYKSFAPDVIVTDVDMPVMSGLEMIEKIKNEDPDIPILITSGLSGPRDIARGYNLKIDNYIDKPFSTIELNYKIEAILRRVVRPERNSTEENKIYTIGSFMFDPQSHFLIREDKKTNLTPLGSQILQLLCENKGKIVKRKDILIKFWEDDDSFKSRSLDVIISKLRKCLSEDKSIEIENVRKEGLKLVINYL